MPWPTRAPGPASFSMVMSSTVRRWPLKKAVQLRKVWVGRPSGWGSLPPSFQTRRVSAMPAPRRVMSRFSQASFSR